MQKSFLVMRFFRSLLNILQGTHILNYYKIEKLKPSAKTNKIAYKVRGTICSMHLNRELCV
jgi:hypothetical protein